MFGACCLQVRIGQCLHTPCTRLEGVVIKPTLQMKQDFLVRALADKRFHRRRKVTLDDGRRVAFSAFDGAVLACIVNHVNTERGYAYVGSRAVAELVGCNQSAVIKTINKCKDLEILFVFDGGKKNKAQRLEPNWAAYLEFADDSLEEVKGDASHTGIVTDASHEEALPITPMKAFKKGRKTTLKGVNGTSGAARVARASLPGGRSSASHAAPAATVDDVMALRAARKTEGGE
jgi:hypothetical protein